MNKKLYHLSLLVFLMFIINICNGQISIDSINTSESTCGNNGIATIYARSNKSDPALMFELISGPSTTSIQNSPVFSSLSPGTYRVKIYDVDFNSKEEQFTITGNYQLPSLNPIGVNPLCPGFTNGQIKGNAVTTKGKAPFTWEMTSPVVTGPQSDDRFINLATGTYTIRMTDACGNFQTRTVILGSGSTGLSQWSNGVPYVAKSGCDSLTLSHTFRIYKEYANIPITLTVQTSSGMISKKIVPIPVDTINFFPGFYRLEENIPGSTYGDYFKCCLTDTCGITVCSITDSVAPFDFDLRYIAPMDCGNKLSAALTFKTYPYYLHNMYTGIKKPVTLTLTDIATNTIVDSTKCLETDFCDLSIHEQESGKNYKLKIVDGCGSIFEKDILWPYPDAPMVGPGVGPGCLDSTSTLYLQLFNFRSAVDLEFLSGPTKVGSTKPGYTFSDNITYPKKFPSLSSSQLSINNLAPGKYTYRISDLCGNTLTDSIEVFPFTLADFNYSFYIKKGCLGDNILYFDGRSQNTAGLQIKDLSTGQYIYMKQGVFSIDSITSLAPGKYGLEIFYGNYFMGGQFYDGSITDNKKDCWAIYDTITIPTYSLNPIKSNLSILCNGNTFVQINADSTSGIPPYQYGITSGPQTFPLQSSNVFNLPTYGIYTVRLVDACGNSNSKQITVDSTKFLPIIKKGPSCLGGKIVLKGISSSYFSYEWKKPDGSQYIGDSLIINPMTTADTGIYYVTKKVNINGCNDAYSSTYHLRLNDFAENTYKLCKGESVKVGNRIYSVPGVYRDTLKNSLGCDSIIISRLIQIPQKNDTNRVAICKGDHIVVGTNTYSLPGTYVDSTLNTGGCYDYIVTYLKVNGTTDTTHLSICLGESISVGNKTYNTTGIYTDTLTAQSGCDSIITTDLIILPPKTNIISKAICQGDHFTVGIHKYDKSGSYIDTISTSTCDSIVTLHLTVNPIKKDSLVESICFGQTYVIGNHIYNKSGIYRDTLVTAACDSIVILNLTVQTAPPPPFEVNFKEHCFEDGDLLIGPSWGKYFLWKPSGETTQYINVSSGGAYSVTITDEFDCKYTGDILIREFCNPRIFVPEAFSPNSDGLHDDLEIFGKYFINFELKIFNRWGEIIFISTDRNNRWDGYYRGELMPIGSYPWIINYQSIFDSNQKKYTMKGSVTLVK